MTKPMLRALNLDVMQACTPAELRARVVEFAFSLGFKTVNAVVVIDRTPNIRDYFGVDNNPIAYLDVYNDPTFSSVDPVMHHLKNCGAPIVWNQSTYTSQGYGSLWEHQARFGYRNGIAVANHLIGGRHFFVGIDSDRPLPKNDRILADMIAELRLFTAHAQEAAFRIFAPKEIESELRPGLTKKEIEALRWTMDGHGASEIAELFSYTVSDVTLLLESAMKKLSCITKHQAVLKAIRLKLLT